MVDSLRRRLRAAAGVPEAPRTTPDRLRSLVRRRRRRRRAVAVAAGVALLGVAGSTGTVLWRSPTQRIEFAEAPSPARAGAAATETTPDPAASGTGRLPPRSAPAERSGDSTPACTEVPEGFRMRDDVDIRDIGDVDGDGNPDRLWIDATRMLGISTAAGGVAPFTVDSAAPSAVSAMAVDADRRPPLELLVSDGPHRATAGVRRL